MKTSYRIAITLSAVLFTVLSATAQLPRDPEERARAIAQIMQTNARQLTLFDREGKEITAVGDRDLFQQPVFSPDGTRLAFVSNADGNEEIYLVNTDGTGLVRLTRNTADDNSPQFSRDGKQIIFSSNRGGRFAIYSADIPF